MAQSGTFTLLMSGLIMIVDLGPKAAVVSESLKAAPLSIPTKSTALGSPQTAARTPARYQWTKNSSLRMPPVYATSSYKSTSVPMAIIAFRCFGWRLAAACWFMA